MKTTWKAIFIALTLIGLFSCEDYWDDIKKPKPQPTSDYAGKIEGTYSGNLSVNEFKGQPITKIGYLADFTVSKTANDKVSINCVPIDIQGELIGINATCSVAKDKEARGYTVNGTTTWNGYPVQIKGFFTTHLECGTPPLPPFDWNAKTDFARIDITIQTPEGDIKLNFSSTRKTNKVLMLIVDYTTNAFEGGKELAFNDAETFTIVPDYKEPGDFGSIEMKYSELNQRLFYGTIVWMGKGRIEYPQNILPANSFDRTVTADYWGPGKGFENVFNQWNTVYDYNPVWSSVQNVVMARNYLRTNPDQTIKIFLYTPSVGEGDPADWKWILFVKN